jgi:hypothetical protein
MVLVLDPKQLFSEFGSTFPSKRVAEEVGEMLVIVVGVFHSPVK